MFGVALGSRTTTVCRNVDNKTEVLQNEGSSRETETVIVFRGQRLIGELGSLQFKSNVENGIKSFNRLLGQFQEQHYFTKVMKEGKFTFTLQDRIIEMNPEALTGAFLAHICPKNCNLTYPDYYTQQEIQSLHFAATIAELNAAFIPESQAICNIVQGNILVIDVGYSKTAAYHIVNNQLLKWVYERQLGIRDMDIALVNHIAKDKFQMTNKLYWRLMDAAEKTRKTLSANKSAVFELEIEDQDIQKVITRDDFQDIINDLVTRIFKLIQCMKVTPQTIELIGGGSRIPVIAELVKQLFPKVTITRTLNATECLSEGASLQITRINYQQPYQIFVGWACDHNVIVSENMRKVFQHCTEFSEGMVIEVSAASFIEVTLFYDPTPVGFKQVFKQCLIESEKCFISINTINALVTVEAFINVNEQRVTLPIHEYRVFPQYLFEQEKELQALDKLVVETHKQKYQLEKLLYAGREHLQKYDQGNREIIESQLNQVLEWVEEKDRTIEEYAEKQQLLEMLFQ